VADFEAKNIQQICCMNSFDGTTSTIVVQSTPTVMNNESKTFKA
jgi:hypothetical protein